jgi:stalled ribosome alternative rescue factor ArfA
MAGVPGRIAASVIACALAGGCSSSGPANTGSSRPSSSVDASAVAVQTYLDAVNKLCDDLLPKVVEVTNGGSFDIALREFFAQLRAHARLRADFDRQLALVPVPAAAQDKARILQAYIRFANELDRKRLTAARQGQASYQREIAAEKRDAVDDPTITARTAAGFNESCNAR